MHGTVYTLVNNIITDIPTMRAQCKQRDAASFPFHFEVSCTNQLRSYLANINEREHDMAASLAIKKHCICASDVIY